MSRENIQKQCIRVPCHRAVSPFRAYGGLSHAVSLCSQDTERAKVTLEGCVFGRSVVNLHAGSNEGKVGTSGGTNTAPPIRSSPATWLKSMSTGRCNTHAHMYLRLLKGAGEIDPVRARSTPTASSYCTLRPVRGAAGHTRAVVALGGPRVGHRTGSRGRPSRVPASFRLARGRTASAVAASESPCGPPCG